MSMIRTSALVGCSRCRRPAYWARVPFHEIGMASTSPHFSPRSRMIAKGFAPSARRDDEEWLFHCEEEQRSARRKERASAAKRKDAGDKLQSVRLVQRALRSVEMRASFRAGVRNAGLRIQRRVIEALADELSGSQQYAWRVWW